MAVKKKTTEDLNSELNQETSNVFDLDVTNAPSAQIVEEKKSEEAAFVDSKYEHETAR
jgi:hypothetical protein